MNLNLRAPKGHLPILIICVFRFLFSFPRMGLLKIMFMYLTLGIPAIDLVGGPAYSHHKCSADKAMKSKRTTTMNGCCSFFSY